MTTITVSKLPNINFYTGQDSITAGSYVENRQYGVHSDYYGDLNLTNDNNSFWSYIPNSIFSETPIKYYNVGDIIDATISYMNKFKDNNVDIEIDKNILTFNYKYKEDLESNYNNTSYIPSSQFINLLVNINDMNFNKLHYYGKNNELKEITYAYKKYPYNKENTIITVTDAESETLETTYDFSKQFVNFNYNVLSYDVEYTRSYLEPYNKEDGTIGYYETGQTYIEVQTFYTYEINNIDKLNDRIKTFFDSNSERVENEYNDLKTYYISELDTSLSLTLNTYSLGPKKLYAYFNFTNKYDNWFDKSIAFTMNTENLNINDKILSIEPISKDWFNVIVNDHDKPCGNDINVDINNIHDFNIINKDNLNDTQLFKIINPTNIKTIDLSNKSEYITSIDLINNYNKRINVNTVKNESWINGNVPEIENLIIGNSGHQAALETISGINKLTNLKTLDITNCNKLKKDFSIRKLSKLNVFKAKGSSIKSFIPYTGNEFNEVTLPETLKTLILKNTQINNFDYIPTGNLINLTLDNVTGIGIDIQDFIVTWISSLKTTIAEDGINPILYDGIVQNTNLTNINFENFDINTLKEFSYLGLKDFSGNISIGPNQLNRKEYQLIKEIEENDIMKDINLTYSIDENSFKKPLYLYYLRNDSWSPDRDINNNLNEIHYLTIDKDSITGNSLFDYIEERTFNIELTLNSKGFGFEADLEKVIYTDTNNKLTNNLNVGDLVIYKGKKLILVTKRVEDKYKYVKVGNFELFTQFYNENINKIKISQYPQ